MKVYVLLYEIGTENEGVHTLEIDGQTILLMFENEDDASRYCGLLEAQDFPKPSLEQIQSEDIEEFCSQNGYEARLVENGFVPKNDTELLMLAPPELNKDVSNWIDDDLNKELDIDPMSNNKEYDQIRKRLEDLL